MAQNSRSMKIALSIKRKKKAGKLINGSINITKNDAKAVDKRKTIPDHKLKGGVHAQKGGPDNVHLKGV